MPDEKRSSSGALRLKKYMPIAVEDKLTFTLFRASVADLSATGLRIITSEFLSKGTRWTLTMKQNPFLVLKAEVRWVKMDTTSGSSGSPQYQVGMQFIDVPADETKRLQTFLEFEKQRALTT